MTDKIKNYYNHLPNELKRESKTNKTFKNHHILPNSMICAIGGTGSGKSNSIIDLIHRMNGTFYQIIVFNPVSTDEPLIAMLKKQMPEVQLISDINELPPLSSFEDDKDQPKLLIVDDFINLNRKDFKKVNEYFTGGRKASFTVVALAQNYTSIPKVITRNCHYFFILKLNDNTTINNIIRNHNIYDVEKAKFRSMYDDATEEPLSFLMVDLRTKDKNEHLRKCFLNFYKLS